MSEQQITTGIIRALSAKRIWCWRMNSGATVVKTGDTRRFIKMAPSGTPDVMGVLKGGRLFGLEVKTAKGKQQPSQVAWQAKAEANGVYYAVVRSISDALAAVKEASSR